MYLRNRSPTSSFKGATPYERWHGVKPNVEHLRVFGCKVYAHVPAEKRKKLDQKAEKGVFVGYLEGSKGYKIYIPETQKFIRSRDVVFRENSFGNSERDTDSEAASTLDIISEEKQPESDPVEKLEFVASDEEDSPEVE